MRFGWGPEQVRCRTRRVPAEMDTRLYSQLSDAIGAAESPAALVAMGERVRATDMHLLERSALERAITVRLLALSATDTEVPRARPDRAD